MNQPTGTLRDALRLATRTNVPRTATNYTPKRGRPTAKQLEAIDRAILATARAQFLEDGYDAVAMEGVAASAGVSKGTLYSRYRSKEALFTAVIEANIRETSALTAHEEELLGDDIGERLRHHARVIARAIMLPETQAFQKLLLATRDRFPELSRIMYDVGYLYIIGRITDDIEAAAERDRMPARDARSIAQLLVSSLNGWQLGESAHRALSLEEVEAFGARVAELLLAARSSW